MEEFTIKKRPIDKINLGFNTNLYLCKSLGITLYGLICLILGAVAMYGYLVLL